jgi:hypothetical protein
VQQETKAKAIVDVATLTGAVVVALGDKVTGFFTPCDDMANAVDTAAKSATEFVWRLPLHEGYNDILKSKIADTKNSGGHSLLKISLSFTRSFSFSSLLFFALSVVSTDFNVRRFESSWRIDHRGSVLEGICEHDELGSLRHCWDCVGQQGWFGNGCTSEDFVQLGVTTRIEQGQGQGQCLISQSVLV